jgi:hypothetical protein
MTTYRAISNTEVAVDAPITQQLVQALKDNVLAIQEGDASAPDIALAAHPDVTNTSNSGLPMCAVFCQHATDASQQYAVSPEVIFNRAGTYYCRASISLSTFSGRVQMDIYKNNSVVLTNVVACVQNQSATADLTITVARGDRIAIRANITSGSTSNNRTARLVFFSDNPLMDVCSFVTVTATNQQNVNQANDSYYGSDVVNNSSLT